MTRKKTGDIKFDSTRNITESSVTCYGAFKSRVVERIQFSEHNKLFTSAALYRLWCDKNLSTAHNRWKLCSSL